MEILNEYLIANDYKMTYELLDYFISEENNSFTVFNNLVTVWKKEHKNVYDLPHINGNAIVRLFGLNLNSTVNGTMLKSYLICKNLNCSEEFLKRFKFIGQYYSIISIRILFISLSQCCIHW